MRQDFCAVSKQFLKIKSFSYSSLSADAEDCFMEIREQLSPVVLIPSIAKRGQLFNGLIIDNDYILLRYLNITLIIVLEILPISPSHACLIIEGFLRKNEQTVWEVSKFKRRTKKAKKKKSKS